MLFSFSVLFVLVRSSIWASSKITLTLGVHGIDSSFSLNTCWKKLTTVIVGHFFVFVKLQLNRNPETEIHDFVVQLTLQNWKKKTGKSRLKGSGKKVRASIEFKRFL